MTKLSELNNSIKTQIRFCYDELGFKWSDAAKDSENADISVAEFIERHVKDPAKLTQLSEALKILTSPEAAAIQERRELMKAAEAQRQEDKALAIIKRAKNRGWFFILLVFAVIWGSVVLNMLFPAILIALTWGLFPTAALFVALAILNFTAATAKASKDPETPSRIWMH